MTNIISLLSSLEQKTVLDCLRAAELEDIFPEWEFETLFGISRSELSKVRQKWPNVDSADVVVGNAIVGSLNHLLGYAVLSNELWDSYIDASPKDVKLLLDKLLELGL